ncbi:MAG: DUF3565 domain-containing protein [Gemmatimonadaceae bacterium]|nr:DUF3565 domain-containing protein [Gemmatimonadaceae bacterium]
MRQPITGYHVDVERQWVAELRCGHAQHVRHEPPWQDRPWTITEEGRASHLGSELECPHCDGFAMIPAAMHDAGMVPQSEHSRDVVPMAEASRPAKISALFSSVERGSPAVVPPRLEISAVFGNVELDLRTSHFDPQGTEIIITATFGNVEICLPVGTIVENHGSGILASVRCRVGEPMDASAPRAHVRITGRAILSSIEITDGLDDGADD